MQSTAATIFIQYSDSILYSLCIAFIRTAAFDFIHRVSFYIEDEFIQNRLAIITYIIYFFFLPASSIRSGERMHENQNKYVRET